MAIHVGPKIDTTGLLFHIDAANTRSYPGSGTTVTDMGSSNVTTTLMDGPTFSSSNNGSWVFDGLNDRIHAVGGDALHWTQNGAVGTAELTVDMWFKTSSFDGTGSVLSYAWNGSGQYNYIISTNGFSIKCGSSTDAVMLFGRALNNNVWTHIVCWASATNIGYYLNGTEYSSSAAHSNTGGAANLGNTENTLCIMSVYPYPGGWGGDTTHAITGNLASVKIYNRVLTQAEAVQSFNGTRKRFGV